MTATIQQGLDVWGIGNLDVEAYLDKIGHIGERSPTVDTLRALHRAHATTIPFENLDVVLQRRIDLDVEALQDKLVRRPRGGYCYEHTLLFAALLERLGFAVTRLSGRVRIDSDTHGPRSHAALWVEADGQAWLADVGFGAERPLEPIRFAAGVTARQGGWTYRLDGVGSGEWVLRTLRPNGWFDLYSIDLAVVYPSDFAMQNHYTATHPDSPLVSRIIVQHTAPDVRHTLLDDELRATSAEGVIEQRRVPSAQLAEVLRDTFGIVLEPDEVAELMRLPQLGGL
jgi:N-hydroxyarylamine O-acetyltransferase